MHEREPKTQTLGASEACQQWSHLLDKVSRREARIIVERSGVPVAALVSAEDLERLTRIERERAERWAIIERVGARNADIAQEEIEQDIADAIEEVRSEERTRAGTQSGA
jgi:prevent-host-death family protein